MEQRLDHFYTWAQQLQLEMRKLHTAHAEIAVLQSEIRNLQQRVGVLEAILQNQFNFAPSSDENSALLARLARLNR